jgi:hypothetical protein
MLSATRVIASRHRGGFSHTNKKHNNKARRNKKMKIKGSVIEHPMDPRGALDGGCSGYIQLWWLVTQ